MPRKQYAGGKYMFQDPPRKSQPLTPVQKKQVKRIVSSTEELKYFSLTALNGTTSSTMGVADLTQIAQGDGDTQRNGDRVQLCGTLDIRMVVQNSQGGGFDAYNVVRFIVFQWHPNTTPTVGDILLAGPSSVVDVYSQYSHDNRQQYKILKDYTFTTIAASDKLNIFKHFLIPMKRASKNVQFSSGTTTGTNKIYYILGSDSGVSPHPTYTLSTKLFFRDA